MTKLTARAGDTYPKEYPWRGEKEALSVLECVRMVATEIEMAAPGFTPVTPPQRVSTAPSSPLGGAVASGILDEEGQTAVADVLQPGIDADAEVLAAVASGTLDEEGQYQEKLPPLMVLSPATRLRSKAASPLVRKRSQKYCQNEDCVFNRMVPGQPARKELEALLAEP